MKTTNRVLRLPAPYHDFVMLDGEEPIDTLNRHFNAIQAFSILLHRNFEITEVTSWSDKVHSAFRLAKNNDLGKVAQIQMLRLIFDLDLSEALGVYNDYHG